jgi:ribonuclease HIII
MLRRVLLVRPALLLKTISPCVQQAQRMYSIRQCGIDEAGRGAVIGPLVIGIANQQMERQFDMARSL